MDRPTNTITRHVQHVLDVVLETWLLLGQFSVKTDFTQNLVTFLDMKKAQLLNPKDLQHKCAFFFFNDVTLKKLKLDQLIKIV